jgi:hypothetical protein
MVRFSTYAILAGLAASLWMVGCASNGTKNCCEPTLIHQTSSQPSSPPAPGALEVTCEQYNSWYTRWWSHAFAGGPANECVHEVVTEESVANALSGSQELRDQVILTVLYLSDRNCDNFRAHRFASCTATTYVEGVATSFSAGASAAKFLAIGSRASANAASIAASKNILSEKCADPVTVAALAAIDAQRAQLKSQILAGLGSSGNSNHDVEANLETYDSLCCLLALGSCSVGR